MGNSTEHEDGNVFYNTFNNGYCQRDKSRSSPDVSYVFSTFDFKDSSALQERAVPNG